MSVYFWAISGTRSSSVSTSRPPGRRPVPATSPAGSVLRTILRARVPLTKSSLTSALTLSNDNVMTFEIAMRRGRRRARAASRGRAAVCCTRRRAQCLGRLWKCLPRPPYPGGVPRLLEPRVDAARTVDAEAYIRNRHAENRARHDGLRARAAASAPRGLRPVKDDPRSPRRRWRRLPSPHLNGLFSLKQIIDFLLVKGIIHNLFRLTKHGMFETISD